MIKETISCDICHSIMEPDTNCDIDFFENSEIQARDYSDVCLECAKKLQSFITTLEMEAQAKIKEILD